MKPSVAKRYQQMVDAATTRCGEPVVAVLTCQHVGTYGRALEAIGGLASVKRRSAKRAAGGLPDNVLLALTSSSLHAFDFRPTMRGVKLRKQAASWPRPDVRIQTEPRLAVTILWITVSSRQDTIELETPSVMGAQEILDLFLETLDG